MKYGYYRIASAIPNVRIADCHYNAVHIKDLIKQADKKNVSVITFPELSITGYTCGDLFNQSFLIEKTKEAVSEILEFSKEIQTIIVIGAPVRTCDNLFNTAIVIQKGKILGIVPKISLPNYSEFYEVRWFASGKDTDIKNIRYLGREVPFGIDLLFSNDELCFGIELCEDLWTAAPPSSSMATAGANMIINLSASNELVGKNDYLKSLILQQSARTMSAYIYSSCGFGESTTDLVFAGNALIAENGVFLNQSERFSLNEQLIISDVDIEKLNNHRLKTNTFSKRYSSASQDYRMIDIDCSQMSDMSQLKRNINPYPFIPNDKFMNERCEEIFNIQVWGLAQRISHTNSRSSVIGISGGLDSTLALLVCVQTYDKLNIPRSQIIGVTMPGFGTTSRTYNNAINLMKSLGVTIREIDIKKACMQHFEDLNIDPNVHDVTYENTQARERTQILMDIANQTGGMVIGTGDLSELALGWATYNGDHMSMYGVNGSIPKTLVKYLVKWVALNKTDITSREILLDVIDTPISPELIPADENGEISQKTEDLVGPYELHDFFLYNFIRQDFPPLKIFELAKIAFAGIYDDETIKKWLTTFIRRFFNQQFKRSCLPDGPKVGSVSLSPRGDWRMPSDASSIMWLKELE